jgi:prepilin-type N-terminal cleavage/methylation domain-containing protein
MREIRPSGLEGGVRLIPHPYPYPGAHGVGALPGGRRVIGRAHQPSKAQGVLRIGSGLDSCSPKSSAAATGNSWTTLQSYYTACCWVHAARLKGKVRMKNRKVRVEGFTLVELMIVVGIIGMLAAIAIPNWVHARTTSQNNACISNLREIFGAMQQWALDNRKGPSADVTPEQILPYLRNAVVCPAGGAAATFGTSYLLTTVSNIPTCRIAPAAHLLAPDTTN